MPQDGEREARLVSRVIRACEYEAVNKRLQAAALIAI
jgi:hypothetical protein